MPNSSHKSRRPTLEVVTTTFWERRDTPGHDVCKLLRRKTGWRLEGIAIFKEGTRCCALTYAVDCDALFRSRSAKVSGFIGDRSISLVIRSNRSREWFVNDRKITRVTGCDDLDLNFTPATNLLSLRRMPIKNGDEMEVQTAWLKFPALDLQPLRQTYRRLNDSQYDYASPSLSFKAKLTVDRFGFVLEYPPLWSASRAIS